MADTKTDRAPVPAGWQTGDCDSGLAELVRRAFGSFEEFARNGTGQGREGARRDEKRVDSRLDGGGGGRAFHSLGLRLRLDWLWRAGTYLRLRERANDGMPALSVQTYGDVLSRLTLRFKTDARLHDLLDEIVDHFRLIDLTPGRAEAYAEVVDACRRSDADVAHEAWFAWQVALARGEGHRIMTKGPQRYRNLVGSDALA